MQHSSSTSSIVPDGGIRRILTRPQQLSTASSTLPLPYPSLFSFPPASPSPSSSSWSPSLSSPSSSSWSSSPPSSSWSSSPAGHRTHHFEHNHRIAYKNHHQHHNPRQHMRLHVRATSRDSDTTTNKHAEALLRSLGPGDQLIVVLVGLPGCGKSTVAARIASLSPPPSFSSSSLLSASSSSSAPAASPAAGGEGMEPPSSLPSRRWAVACQDVLRTRKKVYSVASTALARQQSVVIDRCNFDAAQRAHWLKLAEEHRHGWAGTGSDQEEEEEEVSGGAGSGGGGGQLHTMCVVLPRPDDVDFCARRAFGRGNDGVHEPGTDWATVCRRMKREFTYPAPDEGFDAVFVCADERMLEGLTALFSTC